jgi:uncharacterized protein (DUF2235 family)
MSPTNPCFENSHPKNIIVFCDGTWNVPDEKSGPTNVTRIFEAVTPYDANGNPQIAHYIQGVGTSRSDRVSGGGFGLGISRNIKEGYQFICSNYQPGDHLFLFGFSRGAYTARSIAGFIHNLGILTRPYFYKLNSAYKYYRDNTEDWKPDSPNAMDFQSRYCWPSKDIYFLGVWDTVGALGAPYGVILGYIIDKLFKCSFHDTKLSSSIHSAYHAVAIDEKRWPFRPTLWTLDVSHVQANFEEHWFPGVHSDVGGGYENSGLSDVTLDWMASKACLRGLSLDLNLISNPPVTPDPHQDKHDSQTVLYRLATLAFVKIPASLGIPLPGIAPAEIAKIDWSGDYHRTITPGAAIGHSVGNLTQCCTAAPPDMGN